MELKIGHPCIRLRPPMGPPPPSANAAMPFGASGPSRLAMLPALCTIASIVTPESAAQSFAPASSLPSITDGHVALHLADASNAGRGRLSLAHGGEYLVAASRKLAHRGKADSAAGSSDHVGGHAQRLFSSRPSANRCFWCSPRGYNRQPLLPIWKALGHLGVGGEIRQNRQRFAHHTSPNLPEKAVKFFVTA